jgi:hypothetical protein
MRCNLTSVNGWHEEALIEPAVAAPKDWAAAYARGAFWGMFIMALIAGFAEGASANDGVRLLTALGVPWTITLYFALDARAHQKVFVHSFWLITFFSWPIAALFHLVRTRGKRGALIYALYAALYLFCLLTSAAIGSLVKK